MAVQVIPVTDSKVRIFKQTADVATTAGTLTLRFASEGGNSTTMDIGGTMKARRII